MSFTTPISPAKIKQGDLMVLADSMVCSKLRSDGVIPTKTEYTDICWDLTLIARDQHREEDSMGVVNKFLTGVSVVAPKGHHFELVPKKELADMGYFIPGTVVLPRTYEEIQVPLVKFSQGAEDLELPCKAVSIVLRETVYANIVETSGGEKSKKKKNSKMSQTKLKKEKSSPFY